MLTDQCHRVAWSRGWICYRNDVSWCDLVMGEKSKAISRFIWHGRVHSCTRAFIIIILSDKVNVYFLSRPERVHSCAVAFCNLIWTGTYTCVNSSILLEFGCFIFLVMRNMLRFCLNVKHSNERNSTVSCRQGSPCPWFLHGQQSMHLAQERAMALNVSSSFFETLTHYL